MNERLRLYRVTATVEYEYVVAAMSIEEARALDVDTSDLLDQPEPWRHALEITDAGDLDDWEDEEPYGDTDLIDGRTCAEILEVVLEPTDLDLEAAGQMTLLGAA